MTPTDFRADVEGLRALAVVAVLLFHAEVAGFTGGFVGVDVFFVLSGFLITRLLLAELGRSGTHLAAVVLGSPGPPAAAGVGPGDRRDAGGITLDAAAVGPALGDRRRHRRGDVRRQPRLRRSARRLLRRPARRAPAVAVPALLVAVPRGAVLRRLAAGAGAHRPPAAPAPAPPADRHRHRRRPLARRVDRLDPHQPDLGLLPAAAAHGRAARRRGRRRRRAGVRERLPPPAGRPRLVGSGRHPRRRRALRRRHRLPGHGGDAAGAGHGARARRGRARRRSGRTGPPPLPTRGSVGRRPVVRHLPVALAGARAHRRPVRAAVDRGPGRSRPGIGRCRRLDLPPRRGSGPPRPLAGGRTPARPRPRRRAVRRRRRRRRPRASGVAGAVDGRDSYCADLGRARRRGRRTRGRGGAGGRRRTDDGGTGRARRRSRS